MKLVWRP